MFVSYSKSGRCDLDIYDPVSVAIRRMGAGLRSMMMPAISPAGRKVAVVASADGPTPSRLYVLDLASGRRSPCPVAERDAAQTWPQWSADGQIVYVLSRSGSHWLARWQPAKSPPERLCQIDMPDSRVGVYQTLANLSRPLSPDGRRFAYYDIARDRIVIVGLRDGQRQELGATTRSGCWLDSRRFVVADNKEMLLTETGPPVRLMRGLWLPLGGRGGTSEFVACTRGSHSGVFALVGMKLIPTGP